MPDWTLEFEGKLITIQMESKWCPLSIVVLVNGKEIDFEIINESTDWYTCKIIDLKINAEDLSCVVKEKIKEIIISNYILIPHQISGLRLLAGSIECSVCQ